MKAFVKVRINGKNGKYEAIVDSKVAFKACQAGYDGSKLGNISEIPLETLEKVDVLHGNGQGRVQIALLRNAPCDRVIWTNGVILTKE